MGGVGRTRCCHTLFLQELLSDTNIFRALVGFCLGLTPLSCDLMGLREAGGAGSASTGDFVFLSGPLLILSGLMEFILGNTFSFVVFMSYGSFYMAVAGTIIPWFNSAGAYSSTGTNFVEGLESPAFNSSFAFLILMMAVLNLLFLVCSTRTNVGLFVIFVAAVPGFAALAGAHWKIALGQMEVANTLTVASGALFFVCAIGGWYLLCAQMLETTQMPFQLPVGDLSRFMTRKASTTGKQAA